ncbi:MAG: hypothetical protein OHK0039_38750 [Bacteroidia bacterium]
MIRILRLLSLLLLFVLPMSGLLAQQEPIYTQYRINAFVINPAVAGTQEVQEFRMNLRSQWTRMPGEPRTMYASYQGPVDEKSSFGAALFHDEAGPSVRNGLQLAYAFRAPAGLPGKIGQNYLSLGMAGKLVQYRFRAEQVYFENPDDAAIYEAAEGALVGDVALGLYFYNDKLWMGISAPNLIQSTMGTLPDAYSRSLLSRLYRHYFAGMGYRFDYGTFAIEPGVMVRKVGGAPYQIEGTVKFFLADDHFVLGMSYRTDWLGTFLVGLKSDRMQVYYATDLMLKFGYQGSVFGATHELTLGIDIGDNMLQRNRYYREPE